MTGLAEHAFPASELARRLVAVRAAIAAAGLDGIVVSVPENIYYLTGLDHWGFFACHLLVVPRDGELILTCRAMERVTVENHVRNARFLGHADHEDIVDFAVRALSRSELGGGRLGLEMRSPLHHPARRLLHPREALGRRVARRLGTRRCDPSGQVAARGRLHASCRAGRRCRHPRRDRGGL